MADQKSYNYIQLLHEAIHRGHNCEAKHVDSVPIKEEFQGKTIWEGIVEVFDLTGHPKAKQAYAWSHKAVDGVDYEVRTVVVLGIPPVDSARKAVQASILSEIKQAKK
jgi:hypothetical protein